MLFLDAKKQKFMIFRKDEVYNRLHERTPCRCGLALTFS